MKKYKLLNLFLAIILLCGCTPKQITISVSPAVYEYTENVYMRIWEPYGTSVLSSSRGSSFLLDGTKYVFWEDISEVDRDNFLSYQQVLINFLSKNGIVLPSFTTFVLANSINRTESESHAAYIDISSSGTYMQILTTLQAVLGDYTNYGYLYALSNYIATELGWQIDEITAISYDNLTAFLKDSPVYLSLTYPCFTTDYTDEHVIEYSKALAKMVFSKIENSVVFADNQESAFAEAISGYASENGIEYIEVPYMFAYNGTFCPLKFKTQYYEAFVTTEYNENTDYYEWDLFGNYTNIIKTLDITQESLKQIRDVFEFTDEYVIPIVFRQIRDYGGLYHRKTQTIDLENMFGISHEYAHYIFHMLGGDVEKWYTEIVASYYGMQSYFERIILLNRIKAMYNTGRSDETFEWFMGRQYQEMEDIEYGYDLYVYTSNDFRVEFMQSSYMQWASFGNYFVKNYGDKTFIQSMLRPEEVVLLTNKTMKEIKADWQEYIIATYSVPKEE